MDAAFKVSGKWNSLIGGGQTKISGDGWRKQQNRQLFLNVGGEFERWVFSSDSPELSSSPFCSAQECQGRGGEQRSHTYIHMQKSGRAVCDSA